RMGTWVVPAGTVSTLVSKRWYDDGPIDLTPDSQGLSGDWELLERIRVESTTEVISALGQAVEPLPLNALTLPRLLALEPVLERIDVLTALLPVLRRCRLPAHTLLPVVRRLFDANVLSAHTAGDWITEVTLASMDGPGSIWPMGPAELLLDIAPLKTIKILKRSWPKEVRSWSEDWDSWRLRLAAEANLRLNRRKKAYDLYLLAYRATPHRGMRKECLRALDSLRPEPGAPHRSNRR
ncbi:MAG: hypothetical protein AAFY60_16780, partial [Myxococcota bacterium]